MKTKYTRLGLALSLGSLLWSGIASADGWPTSVVGSWSAQANQSSGTLSITFQSGSGLCRQILGTIFGNPIEGFYCPFSGRVHFVRKNANNDTFQVYTGNLSQQIGGFPLRIGGMFAVTAGAFGEYNFNATK